MLLSITSSLPPFPDLTGRNRAGLYRPIYLSLISSRPSFPKPSALLLACPGRFVSNSGRQTHPSGPFLLVFRRILFRSTVANVDPSRTERSSLVFGLATLTQFSPDPFPPDVTSRVLLVFSFFPSPDGSLCPVVFRASPSFTSMTCPPGNVRTHPPPGINSRRRLSVRLRVCIRFDFGYHEPMFPRMLFVGSEPPLVFLTFSKFYFNQFPPTFFRRRRIDLDVLSPVAPLINAA